MKFVQYYLECLSQASYLIGDEASGRAAVVDPRRDVQEYLEDAAAAGLSIVHVIETHVHADFLSGHLELAEATGASIVYGAGAGLDFAHDEAADGDRLSLGGVVLEIRATPGHTPESISVVIWEHAGDAIPYGVLTGDTLFIGDVGRPDLLSAGGRPAAEMARELYHSLHSRLLSLPDATRVFPAHGAGSACGKNLSAETVSTIGEQRRTNYALQPMTPDEFVGAVTEGQGPPPDYFAYVADRNRRQRALLHEHEVPLLSADDVLEHQAAGAVVLDCRPPEAFARGHLRGSLNVGLEGRFAEYAGEVIDPDRDVVLVCAPGTEQQAMVRLSRVGLDSVRGALGSPLEAFLQRQDVVAVGSRVTAAQLARSMNSPGDLAVLDVRSPGERGLGAVEPSIHVPIAHLRRRLDELDPACPVVVYCASGYRSSIAASLLRTRAFADVSDLVGGYQAWATAARDSHRSPA